MDTRCIRSRVAPTHRRRPAPSNLPLTPPPWQTEVMCRRRRRRRRTIRSTTCTRGTRALTCRLVRLRLALWGPRRRVCPMEVCYRACRAWTASRAVMGAARACRDRATSAFPVPMDGLAMLAPRRLRLRLHSRAPNQALEGRRPSHRRDGLARGRPSALILRREVRTGGWGRQTRQRRQDRTRPRRPRRRLPRQPQLRPRLPRLRGAEKSRRVAIAATRTAAAAAVVPTAAMATREVATLGATGLPTMLAPARVAVWLVVLVERTRVART